MSFSLLWLPALAVFLLVAVIRLVRPRVSWEAFRAGALADVERIRRETRQASEAICGAEALLPLRALLRELPLPAGVSVMEETAGPEEMRVLVTSAQASLMLRLTCSVRRLPGSRRMSPAGVWRLAVRDAGSGSAAPDVSPGIWQGSWPVEESFGDLAACAARLQHYIVDPASTLESLHVPSN